MIDDYYWDTANETDMGKYLTRRTLKFICGFFVHRFFSPHRTYYRHSLSYMKLRLGDEGFKISEMSCILTIWQRSGNG